MVIRSNALGQLMGHLKVDRNVMMKNRWKSRKEKVFVDYVESQREHDAGLRVTVMFLHHGCRWWNYIKLCIDQKHGVLVRCHDVRRRSKVTFCCCFSNKIQVKLLTNHGTLLRL